MVLYDDISSVRVLYAKGFLFLLSGIMASGLLLLETFSLRVAGLLVLSVWSFCRFYYFAFYVIEHYVDDEYRFAGLWQFLRYASARNRQRNRQTFPDEDQRDPDSTV